MNLLSDLSSEVAVALLLDKKLSEKLGSNDAVNLIGKVFDILESISVSESNTMKRPRTQDKIAVSH